MREIIDIIEFHDRLSVLNHYQSFAWDFDKTLIDSPYAPLFHKFILETPEKNHSILTFRTGGMVDSIFDELQEYNLNESSFDEIINISHEAWKICATNEWLRSRGRLKGPLTEGEIYYYNWKGMKCRELGLEVLIDDNIEHTLPGCQKYNIPLFNSLTLTMI